MPKSSKHKTRDLVMAAAILVVFLVVLGAFAAAAASNVYVTDEALWNKADQAVVHIWYVNATDGSVVEYTYNLSLVASYYEGGLVVAIPQKTWSSGVKRIAIEVPSATAGDLAAKGLAKVDLHVALYLIEGMNYTSAMRFGVYLPTPAKMFVIASASASEVEVNGTYSVSAPSFSLEVQGNGASEDPLLLAVEFDTPTNAVSGIYLDVTVYTVTQGSVLGSDAFGVGVLSSLINAFAALYEKIKNVLTAASTGFVLGTLFTGLIGNAVVALLVTAVFGFLMIKAMKAERGR